MNRKLLVSLLQKNIEDLNMITESFMEMNEYPTAIIFLAQRKTQDIQTILEQLADNKNAQTNIENSKEIVSKPIAAEAHTSVKPQVEIANEPTILIAKSTKIDLNTENKDNFINSEAPVVEFITDMSFDEIDERKETFIENNKLIEVKQSYENHEKRISSEEIKKNTIADKIIQPTISRNELMSKVDNSFSATLANKKIEDIKQAISIGDRFRFQRELFKGNGEDMNKTLSYINQLASLNEVISFLKSKYKWDEKNEVTEDFFQIIRRRFQ